MDSETFASRRRSVFLERHANGTWDNRAGRCQRTLSHNFPDGIKAAEWRDFYPHFWTAVDEQTKCRRHQRSSMNTAKGWKREGKVLRKVVEKGNIRIGMTVWDN